MLEKVARQQSTATALEAARCMLVAFEKLGKPKALIDMGCGEGHLVRLASCMGIPSIGVDIGFGRGRHVGFFNHFLIGMDLSKECWDGGKADMVFCWEVGEHIPAEKSGLLCRSLRNATELQGFLVFSSATPGQGGAGHINEQSHVFWKYELCKCGFSFLEKPTKTLRWLFSEVAPSAWWYGKNVMVFRCTT